VTFAEAKGARVPFGKHAGRTIDDVAGSDDGLLYLDWLRDQDFSSPRCVRFGEALEAYLSDPTIARELEGLVSE
jgi:hypothetical protein